MIDHLIHLAGLCAIVFLVLPLSQYLRNRDGTARVPRWAPPATIFSLMTVVGGLLGHELAPGVTLNAHSPMVTVATLAFGPGVGAVTAASATLVRLGLHESTSRVVLILVQFVLVVGLARSPLARRQGWPPRLLELSLAGIAIGTLAVVALRLAPASPPSDHPGGSIAPHVFLAPWLGTLLLGTLVHLQREWQRDRTLLRGALETTPDAFNRVDDSGRILEVNPTMVSLTGYSRAELIGKFLHELRPRETPGEMAAGLADIRARGRHRYETRWRRKDGTEVDLEVSAAVAPREVGGFYAFLRDITERKTAEAQRRFWADAFEHCAHGIVIADPASNTLLACNPAMARLLGRPLEELRQAPLASFYAPDSHPEIPERIAEANRTGHVRFEARLQRGDGSTVPVQMDVVAVRDSQGGPIYRVGTAQDITERLRGEAALRESEARLSEFFDHAESIMWVKDTEGRFLRVNRCTERLVGRPREAILGRTVAELFPAGEAAAYAENDRQVLTSGAPREFEETLEAADGTHTVLATKFPLRDSRGTIHGLGAICVDITARKQAEAALRRAEILQRAILDHIPDPTWLKDLDGRLLAVNQACLSLFGKDRADILGRTMDDLVSRDDARRLALQDEQVLRSGTSVRYEDCLPDSLGRLRWFETMKSRFEDAAGVPLGTLGIAHEITERRRMEVSLRQSEERFRGTLDALIEGCQIIGFDWRYLYVNAAAAASGRSTAEALLGRTMMEAYPGIEETPAFAALRRCMEERVPQHLDNEFRFPDGTTASFELVVQPVPEGIFILSLDITDRKRAEAFLRESEERYRLVAESTTDVIWLYDFGTDRFSYVSPAVERLRGYTAAEVLRQTMAEALTPASYQAVSQRLPRRIAALQAGDESARTQTHEIDQTRRDGTSVPTEVVSTLITDAAGRVTHLQGVTRDITERKLSGQVRQEQEERLRLALDASGQGLYDLDVRTGVAVVNEEYARMLGYDPADFHETNAAWIERLHPDDLGPITAAYRDYLAGRSPEYRIECRQRSRTGEWIWIQSMGRIVSRDAEGNPVRMLGTHLNITERKEAEERSRRLRDFGLVVAGLTDHGTALRLGLDAALAIAGVEAGGIYVVDETTGDLELYCHKGLSEDFVAAVHHFAAGAPNARWAREGEFFHGSVDLLHLPSSASERSEGLRAISLLPILYEGRLLAVLNIASHLVEVIPPPACTDLESVATVLGGVLRRLRAEQALHAAKIQLERRVEERTRELASSEARLRNLLEMAPLPLGVANREGALTFLNRHHLRTFGYTREEVPNLEAWWQRAYPDESYRRQVRERWDAAAARAARAGTEIEPQECRVTCRDGSVRDVVVSGIDLDSDILATFLDITELRKADAMLRTLRSALEQSPSVVMITDQEGTIQYVNPRFESQTGYRPEEAIGRNPRMLKSGVHPPEFYRQLWKSLLAGEVWRGEICNRRKDGSLFWESTAIAPVHDAAGNLSHYVAIKEDTTERRRTADEIRLAKEAAEAASRAKSRFLANMSHEIRTPMNAILGFAQLLQRDPGLSDHHRKHLRTINRSGEHLLRLINDILDMSKIEAGRLQPAPADCDFHGLVDDMAGLFRTRAEEKGLVLEVSRAPEVPARLHTDGVRVRQVLINLLGNALKFTDHGHIGLRITLGAAPPSAPDHPACRVCVDVTDTGPGIASDELERLFEPFEQARVGHHHGGTGLGLAISRQLARLLGGDLVATSEPGAGSTFRFTFAAPVLGDAGSGTDADGDPAGPARRVARKLAPGEPVPTLLIADDVASNRELLRVLLEEVGFAVREVGNGAEAVAFCESHRPALVLMDGRMPVLDGLAATRAIRAGPAGADTRILLVSANVLGDAPDDWQAAGADGFLGKPIHHDELLARIADLLKVRYLDEPAPETATPTPRTFSPRAAAAALPAALRAELVDATEAGDVSRLRALVAGQIAPRDLALAQLLVEYVAGFDYPSILELLRPSAP